MFLWTRLLFIHKTKALNSLFSNWYMKKTLIWPDFTEYVSFRLQAKVLNLTRRTISICKLKQIVNFDGLIFLTAWVLYNKSNNLNHSNKDSDWLIVACFIKEIKNAPSALLSYISTREFLGTRAKCGEAHHSPLAPLGQADEWTAKPSWFSVQGSLPKLFRIMAAKTLKNPYRGQTVRFKLF